MMSDEFETERDMPNVLLDEFEDAREEEEVEEFDGPCVCGDDDDVLLVNGTPSCAPCRMAHSAFDAAEAEDEEEGEDEVDPTSLD